MITAILNVIVNIGYWGRNHFQSQATCTINKKKVVPHLSEDHVLTGKYALITEYWVWTNTILILSEDLPQWTISANKTITYPSLGCVISLLH